MATFLPTVLIGVGGTGQSVLTYVKKEIRETNEGKDPENIKYLCFDTMPEGNVGGDTNVSEEVISLGNVFLERNVEFIGLSGNGWAIGQQVLQGNAPHIGKKVGDDGGYTWLDAEYLSRFPALWSLSIGAGRVRQFGRLGYFMKIDTDIQPKIKRAFELVKQSNPKKERVNIILVGSMAGGTGAGLFVDMGILCRSLAGILDNNITIIGFNLFPRAFIGDAALGDAAKHMMARSFAGWRELDRFMNVAEHQGKHVISYKGNHSLDIAVDQRPFDLCYMVDSYSQANALTIQKPMEGVYPAMADFITFMLDAQSGDAYQKHVANYLPDMSNSNKPGYSAFRTYSVRTPIYYDLESNALQLGKDLLERWLIPVRHEQSKAIIGLKDNANLQVSNQKGKNEVVPFLSAQSHAKDAQIDRIHAKQTGSGATGSEAVIQNTHFMKYLAQIYNWKTEPEQFNDQVLMDARGGFTYRGQDDEEGINMMTPIGRVAIWPGDYDDTELEIKGQKVKKSQAEILQEAETSVWRDLKAIQQDVNDPAEALMNLKNPQIGLPEYDRTHFGEGAGDSGSFGRMLEVCHVFQLQRFQDIIRHWMVNTLNGTVLDPFEGFTGRLGYVQGFMEELVDCMDFFRNKYLKEVRKHRNAENPLSNTQREERDALMEAESHVDEKCLFFFDHPRARMSREQYLEAVNQRQTVQKDDLTINMYEQLADDMLLEVRKIQEEVQRWANMLVLGGENTSGIYPLIESEARIVENSLETEKNLNGIQHTMPEHRYVQNVPQLDDMLSRITWNVNNIGNFKIGCSVALIKTDEHGDAMVDENNDPLFETRELKSGDVNIDQEWNHEVLMRLCRQMFKPLRKERMILDEVMRDPNFQNPLNLANELVAYYQLLLEIDPNATATAHDKSIFLRRMDPITAKTDGVVQYVSNIENKLQAQITPQNFFTPNSEDKYKLSLINTSDQIKDVEFAYWHRMRAEYLQFVMGEEEEGGARLHIFPAECNAVRYERKLYPLLGKPYRMLHPKVVMLLEHADRVSLFFRALTYGLIKRYEDINTGERKYELDMPYIGGLENSRVKILLWSNMNPMDRMVATATWPDVFDLVKRFLAGKDFNNSNSQIMWDQLYNNIVIKENQLRSTGELQTLIDNQVNTSTEIIPVLRATASVKMQAFNQTHANQIGKDSWSSREDGHEYLDFADVGEMMLKEALGGSTPQVRAS